VLGGLDYIIPHVAQPVIAQLVESCGRARGKPITVLDLGCSYGLNGALLKYGLSLGMLHKRYTSRAFERARGEELIEFDRSFYASWPARTDVRVIGLDSSQPAVHYAESVGAIDLGIVADLESEPVRDDFAEELARVDLIVSTGCVGYVTAQTFETLLSCAGRRTVPWVASFVLRMFDYQDIAQVMKRRRMATEQFEGATFIQRRFRDREEMATTLRELEARDIDCAGKEADGLFHAELFVSRPRSTVQAQPLQRMISVASGTNWGYDSHLRPRRPAAPRQRVFNADHALPA
jgi:SAM-dependent methyltransferase